MEEYEYSQGVTADGAVILKDGQPMSVDQIINELSALQEALLPFAEAADAADNNDDYSGASIWEHSCALDLTVGDLRRARRLLFPKPLHS